MYREIFVPRNIADFIMQGSTSYCARSRTLFCKAAYLIAQALRNSASENQTVSATISGLTTAHHRLSAAVEFALSLLLTSSPVPID